VVLAYLTGSEPTSPLAEQVLDAFVATGRNPTAVSTVTVLEALVRPFRAGPTAVATAEGFLNYFGDIALVEVDYDVAREAARIRAVVGIRTPDALIVATAIVRGTDIIVTNDRSWTAALQAIDGGPRLVVLAD